MSHYRIFGFSRTSRKFLFTALPGTIVCLVATWLVFHNEATLIAKALPILALLLSLTMAAAAVGSVLGLQGWIRKDDSPRLGRWCGLTHVTLLVACGISLFFITKQSAEFRALSAGYSATPGAKAELKDEAGSSPPRPQIPP